MNYENTHEKETVKRIFTEFLKTYGHRQTSERFAILDTIYSINGHFDIDSLYAIMENQEKFRVSRATLYNTILLLLESGLVIKHQFGKSSEYEKCYNREVHHHLICTQCGKVTEFQDDSLKEAIIGTKLKRFSPLHYSLYIYGICLKCERANKRKINNINLKKK